MSGRCGGAASDALFFLFRVLVRELAHEVIVSVLSDSFRTLATTPMPKGAPLLAPYAAQSIARDLRADSRPRFFTMNLPPPTNEEIVPHTDLTGQVIMTEDAPFAYGRLSEVYRGAWTDPRTNATRSIAIKILRGVHRDPETLTIVTRCLNRETWVWHTLSHENILEFLGISNDLGPAPAMISPLCDEGRIMRYLQNNPEADRAQLICQIAKGLEYLHSKNILHGDINSNNVLVDDYGNALLGDFGSSRILEQTDLDTLPATQGRYIAPELSYDNEDDNFTSVLTKETDVYSFGAVGFEILTGKVPLHTTKYLGIAITKVREFGLSSYEIRYPPEYEGTWKIIERCWAKDPASRPIISVVVRGLSST